MAAILALFNAVEFSAAAKQQAKIAAKFFRVVDKAKSCEDMFDSDFSYDGTVAEMTRQLQAMSQAAIQFMGDLAAWLAELKQRIAGFQDHEASSVFNAIDAPTFLGKLCIAGS